MSKKFKKQPKKIKVQLWKFGSCVGFSFVASFLVFIGNKGVEETLSPQKYASTDLVAYMR